ncbi:MAG: metallophosphoesterase family protein [Jatrophihabitans sp.]
MFDDVATIAVAGDWHGNTPWARRAVQHCADREVSTIVHLGDFGFWPGRSGQRYLDDLEESLAAHDQRLAFVDGNHEDHLSLKAWPLSDGVHVIRPHIVHLPRGYRWTWHGRVWMSLGGAHSIDRKWRTPYVDWWPEEIIGAGDVLRATADGPVDVMLCHDAPEGVPTLTKLFADNPVGVDEVEQALSAANRELVSQVVEGTRPLHLWHGHYHLRLEDEIVAADGHVTQVHGLDCDGTTIDRNMVFVDLTDQESPCRVAKV